MIVSMLDLKFSGVFWCWERKDKRETANMGRPPHFSYLACIVNTHKYHEHLMAHDEIQLKQTTDSE